jgi:hypothetical protein
MELLKARVEESLLRAALSVNREMVLLYWRIGREIAERQQQEGWGAKVVDRLANDLKPAFPVDAVDQVESLKAIPAMLMSSRTTRMYQRRTVESHRAPSGLSPEPLRLPDAAPGLECALLDLGHGHGVALEVAISERAMRRRLTPPP